MFLEILQSSQEKSHARDSFSIKLQASYFKKFEVIWNIFNIFEVRFLRTLFFSKTHPVVASEKRLQKNNYNGLFFMTHQNAYPKCQILVSYLKQVSIPEQEFLILYPFHDGGPSHIKTSPLICSAKDWAGVYIIGTIAKFLRTFFLQNTSMRLLLSMHCIKDDWVRNTNYNSLGEFS